MNNPNSSRTESPKFRSLLRKNNETQRAGKGKGAGNNKYSGAADGASQRAVIHRNISVLDRVIRRRGIVARPFYCSAQLARPRSIIVMCTTYIYYEATQRGGILM